MPTQLGEQVLSSFAQTDEEAERRYEEYKSRDPFPRIPPALLNSADIFEYVAATGMLYPFDPNALRKPASYLMTLLGKCVYWDEHDIQQVCELREGDSFRLRANSIAFVTLEPRLRLPDYIALRFNLKISHIYKGLLLGTGPLVDPGFDGALSIPLHNLTLNDYTFRGGEGLIWVEFTKLSPNARWKTKRSSRRLFSEMYMPFPEGRRRQWDVEDYLHDAEPQRSVRSSIPEAIRLAEEGAIAAKEESRKISTTSRLFSIGGSLVTLLAVAGLVYTSFTLTQDAVEYITGAQERIRVYESQLLEDEQRIQSLEEELEGLREHIELLEATSTPQLMPTPSVIPTQEEHNE